MNAVLGIYGAQGHGRDVDFMIEELQALDPSIEVVYIDDNFSSSHSLNLRVMNFEMFLAERAAIKEVCIAIGRVDVRKRLSKICAEAGIAARSLISARAVVSRYAEIGKGALVGPHSIVSANVKIGDFFQANSLCNVAHDCRLGNYVTLGPGVLCNGNVHMGDNVYVGAGAIIKQGQNDRPRLIGRNAVIGMGAVVLADVPDGAVVAGNPAAAIRWNSYC